MSTFAELQTKIGIEFTSIDLLERALTHRSFVNEQKEEIKHNERLEFLGDAVLELLITEHLFATYPNRNEGELTSFRAATVRTESLADTASELDLGAYIRMSKGEENTGGRQRPYILANTFEALLGAIYLDRGWEQAQSFVQRFLVPKISTIVENRLDIDSKSKLQELAQDVVSITPNYELIKASGPDHEKTFTMAVFIGLIKCGVGEGKNKQDAEQKAAEEALNNWDKNLKNLTA